MDENGSGKQALGIVGLGRMGSNLALQARERGMRVVGFDVGKVPDELRAAGVVIAENAAEFCAALPPPRAILLYVPAGSGVDAVLEALVPHLVEGDVIADGGNSYWRDSQLRHARLRALGIGFADAGTSGGVEGARRGACFMLGGEPDTVALLEPILTALAVPGGYAHAGPSGAGHFVKLVHNGIEFGMLQAIGEGMSLLRGYPDPLDIGAVLAAYRHGSVIRSWLIDLMAAQYAEHPGMTDVPPYVEDTGEVNWLVEDAMEMEVSIPVIAQSVMALIAGRDRDGWAARAVALMRHAFGGHPFGKSPIVARHRQTSRLADLARSASALRGRPP